MLRKILGNQLHCSPLKYLKKHRLRRGGTHRQWLDAVLTEANNKYSLRVQWQQELTQGISAPKEKKNPQYSKKMDKDINNIFGSA